MNTTWVPVDATKNGEYLQYVFDKAIENNAKFGQAETIYELAEGERVKYYEAHKDDIDDHQQSCNCTDATIGEEYDRLKTARDEASSDLTTASVDAANSEEIARVFINPVQKTISVYKMETEVSNIKDQKVVIFLS